MMYDRDNGPEKGDKNGVACNYPRMTRSQIKADMVSLVHVSDFKPSRDSRSELSSLDSSATTVLSPALIKRVEDEAWVQCEKPDCLKWRRISKREADKLGETEPWYCHMNKDPHRNNCQAQEEDYKKAERLLKKCKLKYRFSALEDGTLVWAKMAGYCKWPAIISADPSDGRSRSLDTDGEPLSYHVEFLGPRHSHGWVHTRFVELYGNMEEQRMPGTLSQVKSAIGVHNRNRSSFGRGIKPKQLHQYRGNHRDSAVEEANVWLKLSPGQRLQRLNFKYDADTIVIPVITSTPVHSQKLKRRMAPPVRTIALNKHLKYTQNKFKKPFCGGKKQGKFRVQKTNKEIVHQKHAGILTSLDANLIQAEKKCQIKKRCLDSNKSPEIVDCNSNFIIRETFIPESSQDVMNVVSPWTSFDENQWNIQVPHMYHTQFLNRTQDAAENNPIDTDSTILTSPRFCSDGQSLKDKLDANNSLLNRTKEEKFTMDIEMFIENQEAFDHDVRKFLKKHGCTLRRAPMWHDVPVTLYQIFLAVYDRGGFFMASKNKQWAAIFRELAGGSGSSGSPAKLFYQKYLLPYELYLKRQEYKHVFKQNKDIQTQRDGKDNTTETTDVDKCEEDDVDDGFSSCSELGELNTMLNEMDNLTSCMQTYPDTECGTKKKSNMCDFKFKFYDDSPSAVSQGVTMVDLTEFKEHSKAQDTIREVDPKPQIDLTLAAEVISLCTGDKENIKPAALSESDMFSLSNDSADQVFEELVTLQKEIENFGETTICHGFSSSNGKILDAEILNIDKILEKLSEPNNEIGQEDKDEIQVVPEAPESLKYDSIYHNVSISDMPNPTVQYSASDSCQPFAAHISTNVAPQVKTSDSHCVPAISTIALKSNKLTKPETSAPSDDNISDDLVLGDVFALQQELNEMDVCFELEY